MVDAPVSRKLLIIGEPSVGKTSLVRRFVLRSFEADYHSTLGVDIYTHTIAGDALGSPVSMRLMIWDTQGDLGARIFKHPYFQGSAGICVVGDVMRPATLSRMVELALGCDVAAPGSPCILMCNKADLIGRDEPIALPSGFDQRRWPLFRTSARENYGVDEAFVHVAKAIQRRRL